MIEGRGVDLGATFSVYVVGWDGVMSFPGYSVCAVPGTGHSVELVRNA
jgi:hypothetical protein